MSRLSLPEALPSLLILCALGLSVGGCTGDSSSNDSSASSTSVDDTRLLGKWNLQSRATLENGHVVTMDNDYHFSPDGTFTNTSRSELLNGDTGEPFCTSTTIESGTWTVEGDRTCWTTSKVELSEFETFTDLITREMIEGGLAGDAPPECWTITSADDSSVTLQPETDGDPITLERSK